MQLGPFTSKSGLVQRCSHALMLKYAFCFDICCGGIMGYYSLAIIVLLAMQVVKLLREAYDRVKALLKKVGIFFF